MIKPKDNTETIDIDNIDDFLPMPGAEDIVTSEKVESKVSGASGYFKKEGPADLSFLDEEENEEESPADDVADIISKLDPGFDSGEEEEEGESVKPGIKKVDKSGLVETFSKLIEEGSIVAFDDDKPLDESSMSDWKELITANFEEKERAVREATPKEFFEALPEELRYAAEYVAKGGTYLKGLFKVLSQSEQSRSLDPTKTADQELIVREYLNAAMNDDELVDEQRSFYWIFRSMLTPLNRNFFA